MLRTTPWLIPVAALLFASCIEQPPPVVTKGFDVSEHEAYFPIGDGAVHELKKPAVDGPISCDGCHLADEKFEVFTCLSCHARDARPLETTHSLIDAFVRVDTACFACHPDGKPGLITGPPPEPGVDAGPVVDTHSIEDFPIGSGSEHGPDNASYMARADAQGVSHCVACHGTSGNRSATLCAECHAADTDPTLEIAHFADPVQSGYEAVTDCKACHATAPVADLLRMAVHAESTDPDHFNAECFECHDITQFQGAPKTWALDFTMPPPPVECAACHAADPREYPSAN